MISNVNIQNFMSFFYASLYRSSNQVANICHWEGILLAICEQMWNIWHRNNIKFSSSVFLDNIWVVIICILFAQQIISWVSETN